MWLLKLMSIPPASSFPRQDISREATADTIASQLLLLGNCPVTQGNSQFFTLHLGANHPPRGDKARWGTSYTHFANWLLTKNIRGLSQQVKLLRAPQNWTLIFYCSQQESKKQQQKQPTNQKNPPSLTSPYKHKSTRNLNCDTHLQQQNACKTSLVLHYLRVPIPGLHSGNYF